MTSQNIPTSNDGRSDKADNATRKARITLRRPVTRRTVSYALGGVQVKSTTLEGALEEDAPSPSVYWLEELYRPRRYRHTFDVEIDTVESPSHP